MGGTAPLFLRGGPGPPIILWLEEVLSAIKAVLAEKCAAPPEALDEQ